MAHGFVRSVLAGYGGDDPRGLLFETAEFGKPRLRGSELHFNLSHSHEMAVLAVAHHATGIDLEHVRPMPDAEQIAVRYFAREEVDEVRKAGAAGFFRCWTRKEAFMKARGEGFSLPLQSFSVSVEPARPRLIRVDGDPEAPRRWKLADIDIAPGYVCAIAVEGGFERLVVREWGG